VHGVLTHGVRMYPLCYRLVHMKWPAFWSRLAGQLKVQSASCLNFFPGWRWLEGWLTVAAITSSRRRL
jgi:hypothetical protein